MTHARTAVLALLCFVLSGLPALAQAAHAVTKEVAPIYLRADGTLTPLRTAAVGTTLKVLSTAGEWVNVEFNDPQLGPRVGWVRRSLLQINDPATTPMDLSVPAPTAKPIQETGGREVTALTERGEPINVRIIDEIDTNPGRGMMITGAILLGVGMALIVTEAAYDCHYGDFDWCSDEDKLILVGGTAMVGIGAALGLTGSLKNKRRSAPRAQLAYTVRF